MAQNFIQAGDVISYTNSTGDDIASGDVVVVGSLAGIALVNIADGATGAVQIEGAFKVAKATGTAYAVGDELFWDAANAEATKTATDTPLGIAIEAAASGDTTCIVKLNASNQVATAANVTFSAGSNLSGVDGTGSNAAPLAGTETRLDALDTAVAAILTSLKNAGIMASS